MNISSNTLYAVTGITCMSKSSKQKYDVDNLEYQGKLLGQMTKIIGQVLKEIGIECENNYDLKKGVLAIPRRYFMIRVTIDMRTYDINVEQIRKMISKFEENPEFNDILQTFDDALATSI